MVRTIADAPRLKREAGLSPAGRKLVRPGIHLILSWSPADTPTQSEMLAAARDALAALALDGHQAVFAIHTDQPHPHLHVVASRVCPRTGRAADLRFDHIALSRWARKYEEAAGCVVCERRPVAPTPPATVPTPASPAASDVPTAPSSPARQEIPPVIEPTPLPRPVVEAPPAGPPPPAANPALRLTDAALLRLLSMRAVGQAIKAIEYSAIIEIYSDNEKRRLKERTAAFANAYAKPKAAVAAYQDLVKRVGLEAAASAVDSDPSCLGPLKGKATTLFGFTLMRDSARKLAEQSVPGALRAFQAWAAEHAKVTHRRAAQKQTLAGISTADRNAAECVIAEAKRRGLGKAEHLKHELTVEARRRRQEPPTLRQAPVLASELASDASGPAFR